MTQLVKALRRASAFMPPETCENRGAHGDQGTTDIDDSILGEVHGSASGERQIYEKVLRSQAEPLFQLFIHTHLRVLANA